MNWDVIEGKWKQLSGSAREKWAKLTDDDWQMINGKREQLIGKIQERYGMARMDAERQVDEWSKRYAAQSAEPRVTEPHRKVG